MTSTPPLLVGIVSDYNGTPKISVGYESFCNPRLHENNTIHFASTYKYIKSLLTHPPCLHSIHPRSTVVWPCESCESTFKNKFWHAAKLLLEYFADFFAKDTAVMHAVWFHLLDVWQESAHWTKYREIQDIIGNCECHEPNWMADVDGVLRFASSKVDHFSKDFRDTVELFQHIIWGRRGNDGSHSTQDLELYDPLNEELSLVRVYQTGPWINGIKPWAQFLNNGGPGVSPPEPRPPLETGAAQLSDGEVIIAKRYIPHAAIALVKKHVERDRDLCEAYYRSVDEDNLNNHRFIFDRYCPVFPQHNAPTHSFISSLLTSKDATSPRRITYTLGNGTPPIVRHPTDRYADETMQVLTPDWNLMDEAVAACLGIGPYEPLSVVEDGPEEDLNDGDDNRVFDMWTVIETRGGKAEEEEAGGNGDKDVFVLGKIFENFCTIEDVENCLKE